MNKKCFCCFESVNNNLDNEHDLISDWLDFRSEELETNLSEEDKRHLLKFDVFADRILDATLDSKTSKLVREMNSNLRPSDYEDFRCYFGF